MLSIIDREYTYAPELGDNYIGDFKCSNKKSIDFNKVLIPMKLLSIDTDPFDSSKVMSVRNGEKQHEDKI